MKSRALPFLAPWLIGLGVLYGLPLIVIAYVSFTDWDGLNWANAKWVGTANFKNLAHDPLFKKSLMNSLLYSLGNTLGQVVVGLALAMLVYHARRGRSYWATVYYLPHVLSGVATVLIWWWLLNPLSGPINSAWRILSQALQQLGLNQEMLLDPPLWLYSPGWAKPSLVLMNLWQAGGSMLVFLAALLRCDPALHEAARIDGASAARRFVSITLPQVSPAMIFNVAAGFVLSMHAFVQPFLLTNYQQQDSLLFYVVYLYQSAFERHRFGYAAAMAWALLGLLGALGPLAFAASRTWIQYEMEEGQQG